MADLLIGPDLTRQLPPKVGSLPDQGGAKLTHEVGAAADEEVRRARAATEAAVREVHAAMPSRLASGEWDADRGRVRLFPPHRRQAFSARLCVGGAVPLSEEELMPEEAMFLMETDKLQLVDKSSGLPLSSQQALNLMLGQEPLTAGLRYSQVAGPCLEHFLVFSRLLRLGLHVRRPSGVPPAPLPAPAALQLDLRARPRFRPDPSADYSCPALFPRAPRAKTWAEMKRRQSEPARAVACSCQRPDATLVDPAALPSLSSHGLLARIAAAAPQPLSEDAWEAEVAAASFEVRRGQQWLPLAVTRPDLTLPSVAGELLVAVVDGGDVSFLRMAATGVPNLSLRLGEEIKD